MRVIRSLEKMQSGSSAFRLLFLAACLHAACSSRQLLQAGPGETTSFPGCTFLSDSEIATNPDFSTLYYELQYTGLNNTLANLQSVVTLFAPTNEAFQQYVAAYNETGVQAMTEPPRGGEAAAFLVDGLELHIATEALPGLSSFYDGQILPTLFPKNNLTVMIEETNKTEAIFLISYGSEAEIVTPPAYACNIIIYGIDSVLIAEESLPFDQQFFSLLSQELKPGGAKVPAALIVGAVDAGDIAQVAAVFDQAVAAGEVPQLVEILEEAVSVPNGVATLAAIANEMIRQTGCGTLLPLIGSLYPAMFSTPESLGLDPAVLQSVPSMDPLLAECALQGI
ncbi:hypothetical protein WJX82_010393 [Trebouxia sp. C0006]